MLKVLTLNLMLLGWYVSLAFKYLNPLLHEGNQTPYERHISKTFLGDLLEGNQQYYVFWLLNHVHHFPGIMGRDKESQILHSQHPINPSYNRNSHLLTNILVLCTTLLKYTRCMVILNIYLYKNQNLQVLLYHLIAIYFHFKN